MTTTYAASGVDIAESDKLVGYIRSAVRSTYSKAVLGDVGLFGAFYDARFQKYKSPVLVSSVDGVGTKLLVAQMMGKHDTIGQDLVNHCVNDILVCGATPLFFMDYFATGKLDSNVATEVMTGFIKACKENKCALIGGETAEMPGFYEENKYDLSGTIVGVVERKGMLTGKTIKAGDVLVGLRSTGLHTNGYSLARRVLLSRYSIDQKIEELSVTLGEALLAIHRSYLAIVSALTKRFRIHGLSHITGGGIIGNTMRMVPRSLGLKIDWDSWERPPLFELIQRVGKVPEDDIRSALNLGIGLVAIVAKTDADSVANFLHSKGEPSVFIGEVVRQA